MKHFGLAVLLIALGLFYQNCSYHKPGEDHKILPFQQGPILSRNAVLVENHDKIFYVNKSLFPTESTFQFDARLNDTVRCEVQHIEKDWLQVKCPEEGTLKVIVFAIDEKDFTVLQEETDFTVLAENQITFTLSEQRLFPLGRDIPDTTFHPNQDSDEPVSGITLYNNYCLRCHGVISSSTVNGRTLEAFQNSLDQISQMRNAPELQNLTDQEIESILEAL